MTSRQSFNLPLQPAVPQGQGQEQQQYAQYQPQQYPQYPQYPPQQYQPMMVPMQQYVPYQQPAVYPQQQQQQQQPSGGSSGTVPLRQSQSVDAPRSLTDTRRNSTAAIRRRRLQSMDIPQRPRRRSSEMAIRPVSREAGIGGFVNTYRRSGIGNNVPENRDSGIGKLCFEENEAAGGERRREAGSFSSSLHKLSSVKKA
ncbi:hypothetical protein GGH99_002472, partial [Coemansia sp. RSA 1285]